MKSPKNFEKMSSFVHFLYSKYNNIIPTNSATLTGAIDVVAVRQPDNTIKATPFHVRFGKAKVTHTENIRVRVTVNGKVIKEKMKLGSDGVAFFTKPLDTKEKTDSRWLTSPYHSPPISDTEEDFSPNSRKKRHKSNNSDPNRTSPRRRNITESSTLPEDETESIILRSRSATEVTQGLDSTIWHYGQLPQTISYPPLTSSGLQTPENGFIDSGLSNSPGSIRNVNSTSESSDVNPSLTLEEYELV